MIYELNSVADVVRKPGEASNILFLEHGEGTCSLQRSILTILSNLNEGVLDQDLHVFHLGELPQVRRDALGDTCDAFEAADRRHLGLALKRRPAAEGDRQGIHSLTGGLSAERCRAACNTALRRVFWARLHDQVQCSLLMQRFLEHNLLDLKSSFLIAFQLIGWFAPRCLWPTDLGRRARAKLIFAVRELAFTAFGAAPYLNEVGTQPRLGEVRLFSQLVLPMGEGASSAPCAGTNCKESA